jgi:hypothetical protein
VPCPAESVHCVEADDGLDSLKVSSFVENSGQGGFPEYHRLQCMHEPLAAMSKVVWDRVSSDPGGCREDAYGRATVKTVSAIMPVSEISVSLLSTV